MEDRNTKQNKTHTLLVQGRECAEITGVLDVDSFDEHCVILTTDCGEMTLEGEELRVGALDISKGELAVKGRISAVYYSDAAPAKRSLRARLFG